MVKKVIGTVIPCHVVMLGDRRRLAIYDESKSQLVKYRLSKGYTVYYKLNLTESRSVSGYSLQTTFPNDHMVLLLSSKIWSNNSFFASFAASVNGVKPLLQKHVVNGCNSKNTVDQFCTLNLTILKCLVPVPSFNETCAVVTLWWCFFT